MRKTHHLSRIDRANGPFLAIPSCLVLALSVAVVMAQAQTKGRALEQGKGKTNVRSDTDSRRPAATLRARLADTAGQSIPKRNLALLETGPSVPPKVLANVTTDDNGCFVAADLPCKPLRIAILDDGGKNEVESTSIDLPRPGAYDIKLTMGRQQGGQSSIEYRFLTCPPSAPRKRRIPLRGEPPYQLGAGWDAGRVSKALSVNLVDLARQHLTDCQIEHPGDSDFLGYHTFSVIRIIYHVREQSVVRPVTTATKAENGRTERQTEVGPAPEGLILRVYLYHGPDQLIRPQTIDREPWKTYFGEIRIPDIGTHVKVDMSFGSKIDRKLLDLFSDPIPWLEALKTR